MKRAVLLFIMFGFACHETFAYVAREGNVWGILGPTLTRPAFRAEDGKTAPWMGGWGLLAVGDINDQSSLELGLLYGNKIYLREKDASSVEEQTQILHATVGYRYWLSRLWSVTGSFYTGYAIGDPSVIHSDIRSGEAYTTTARDVSESGLDLSLEVELWQRDRYGIVLNGRASYAYPFKTDEKSNQLGVLLGFRYFVQGREKFKPEPPPQPGPKVEPTIDLIKERK